jgi:hypothetical protein
VKINSGACREGQRFSTVSEAKPGALVMRGWKRLPPDESAAMDECKSDAQSSTDEIPSVQAGEDIPELNMLFFWRCLSAVMELIRSTKVEPELAQSLKTYNASRCSRSPRAKGEQINQGWVNNAAVQVAKITMNALSMNFCWRFRKHRRHTYSIDGKAELTAVHGILSREPHVPKGALLDAIVDKWRDRIPPDARGRLTDELHRLVPLTYTFLKDIEERSQQGAVIQAKEVSTVRSGPSRRLEGSERSVLAQAVQQPEV